MSELEERIKNLYENGTKEQRIFLRRHFADIVPGTFDFKDWMCGGQWTEAFETDQPVYLAEDGGGIIFDPNKVTPTEYDFKVSPLNIMIFHFIK